MSGSESSAPGSAASRAEAISFTVHSMPVPELPDDRRTRSGRLKMLMVLAVCAAPVIASYFTYFVIRPEGRTNYSTLIDPARLLPAGLALRDLDGASVPPERLHGQWVLLTVAGGACDAACEGQLLLQRQLRESLGRERDRVDKVWLVSDDVPLRPELARAVQAAPAVTVLRVDAEALGRWLEPAAGHRLADHFFIVDPMGHWMMRAPAKPDPGRLRRDLERLLRASGSWDQPGR